MLVLTRKVQQEIVIGNDITITVLEVSGHSVRIGIDAPRDVRVLRRELQQRLEAGSVESPAPASSDASKKSQALVRQPHMEMNPAGIPALRSQRQAMSDRRGGVLRVVTSHPRGATV